MNIYIAGPMTGLPNNNREAFALAEERLLRAGHKATNPVVYCDEATFAASEAMGMAFVGTATYNALVDHCCRQVIFHDALCLLDGWEDSTGANREREAALSAGLEIGTLDDFAPAIKWVGPPEFEPRVGYEGDAGYDLIVAETTRIDYRGWADVPMGISVELPKGFWAMLVGRSSTIRKRQLIINTAIIDNGYRGPLFAATSNFGQHVAIVEKGERIAQLIPMPLSSVGLSLHRVAELSESERGTKAFGSTGA